MAATLVTSSNVNIAEQLTNRVQGMIAAVNMTIAITAENHTVSMSSTSATVKKIPVTIAGRNTVSMYHILRLLTAAVNIPSAIIARKNIASMWSMNVPAVIMFCAIIAINRIARRT